MAILAYICSPIWLFLAIFGLIIVLLADLLANLPADLVVLCLIALFKSSLIAESSKGVGSG